MAQNAAEFLQQDAPSQPSGSAVGLILLLPQGTLNHTETFLVVTTGKQGGGSSTGPWWVEARDAAPTTKN